MVYLEEENFRLNKKSSSASIFTVPFISKTLVMQSVNGSLSPLVERRKEKVKLKGL